MSAINDQPAKKGGFSQKLKRLFNLDGPDAGYPERMEKVKRDAEARKATHAPNDSTAAGSAVAAGYVPAAGGYGGAAHGGDGGGGGGGY